MKNLTQKMKDLGLAEQDVIKLLQSTARQAPVILNSRLKGKTFKFGLVSDTHLGSKFEAINELHTFYEICKERKVDFMLHSGDMVDGAASMHKGFLYDLHKLGADDQIQYVIEQYPNNGLVTYYILGNHDLSHEKANGTNIAKPISTARPDMIYLGDVEEDLVMNGIKIRLYHAGNGAYAISYPMQKYINAIQGGNKPNVICAGHLHSSYYLPYRNIHAIGSGCFEWQTTWMRSKGIQVVVGGWIVTIKHSKGEVQSIQTEFVQFYK